MPEEAQMSKFFRKTNAYHSSYRSLHKRALLYKEGKDYQIYYSTLILSPQQINGEWRRTILDKDPFFIMEETTPFDNMDILIGQIMKNRLILNNTEYYFKGSPDIAEVSCWDRVDRYVKLILAHRIENQFHMLSFILKTEPNVLHRSHIETLEDLLQINKIPYDGASRLDSEFFRAFGQFTVQHGQPFILLYAPVTIGLLRETQYKDDGLNIKLWMDEALKTDAIQIATADYLTTQERTERVIIPSDTDEIMQENTIKHYEILLENPSHDIVRSDIYLSYKGTFISRTSIDNPYHMSLNVKFKAIESIKSGVDSLISILKGSSPGAYERGITLLFGLCNFATLGIGDIPPLTDFADLIVLDPFEPRGLIIECTTDHLIKHNKLSKFVYRFERLQPIFQGYELLPVMCTSLTSTDLTDEDKKQAKENNIIILTYEDIIEIFDYSKTNMSPDFIYNYVKTKSQSQYGFTGLTSY